MAKCSRCGAEDDLAIPFIDGVCEACIRREAEAKLPPPKEVTPRVFREVGPSDPVMNPNLVPLLVIATFVFGAVAMSFAASGDPALAAIVGAGMLVACLIIWWINSLPAGAQRFGAGLTLVGLCVIGVAVLSNTTVETDAGRVYNTGLQQAQLLGFIAGVACAAVGVLIYFLGQRSR